MAAPTTPSFMATAEDQAGRHGEGVARAIDMESVKILRDDLRDPTRGIGPGDDIPVHRAALARLWQIALGLTAGDVAQALEIIREAVRSDRQPGETESDYLARIAGIPSLVFGATEPNAGVDKPELFFAVAYWSYVSGKYLSPGRGHAVGVGLGRMYEWKDAFLKTIRHEDTGAYDEGDIHVDDRATEFASFLLTSPTAPINLFLRMPGESRFGRLGQLAREVHPDGGETAGTTDGEGGASKEGGGHRHTPAESAQFVAPSLDEVLHAINILVWSDRTSGDTGAETQRLVQQ